MPMCHRSFVIQHRKIPADIMTTGYLYLLIDMSMPKLAKAASGLICSRIGIRFILEPSEWIDHVEHARSCYQVIYARVLEDEMYFNIP